MAHSKSARGNSSYFFRSNSSTSISSSISASLSDKYIFPQFPVFCSINETDRLLSDQGLTTPRDSSSKFGRRIRDKSYYKGLIHLKSKEIREEIKKLQKEVSMLSVNKSTYLPYRKKAESKARELRNLRQTLGNYNTVDDMLNRDIDFYEAKEELQNLKEDNEKENAEVEKLFDMTKKKELILKELETDLSQENYVSEILTTTASVNPKCLEKCKKLKRVVDRLQSEWVKQQEQLDNLKKERADLEQQCSENENLAEASGVVKKLRQLKNQREELFTVKKFDSVSVETDYLEKTKAECSDLLKGMMQETRNLQLEIKELEGKLSKIDTENSKLYKERAEKYSKLKKKEHIIDEFLTTFCDQQLVLLEEQSQHHSKVTELLRDISNKLAYLRPDIDIHAISSGNDKKDAELKSLYLKKMNELKETLKKMDNLNTIENETDEERMRCKNEIELMGEGILKLEESKENLKNKEMMLSTEKREVKKQKRSWKFIVGDLRKRYNSLEKELNNNETYMMLSNLEKRWHVLEAEKFAIEEFIALKNSEKSYLVVKEDVRKIYSELNKML